MTRLSASARGYSTDWRRLRAAKPPGPCVDCKQPWEPGMHLDHVIPRARGGTDDDSNLVWRHRKCHSRKTVRQDGGFGKGHARRVAVSTDGWPQET